MKGAATTVLLSLFFLATVSVHCYSLGGHDPLGKLLTKARKATTTTTTAVTDANEQASRPDGSNAYRPVHVADQYGLKQADRITKLPGQPPVKFSQYSGYVTVNHVTGKSLFYWLTESETPATAPLVLWLNGGPGCSSIGNGAMTELGPFRVNPDGKTLWYNKYAWNTVANVLFLESPAGVGFSYSNTTSDYTTGDWRTADDAYFFLVNWLARFPEYKNRDFYITGESYAGHYVPQLAWLIVKNSKFSKLAGINLKGIAIGNAYIDYEDEMSGLFDYFWTHALLSDENHDAVIKNCDFSSVSVTPACNSAMDAAEDDWGNVFFYDIYAPLCGSNSTAEVLATFDPCSDNYVEQYLNTPEVQKALHANVTGTAPGPWSSCSGVLNYSSSDPGVSVLPVIKDLMTSGISVWIYSGDTDGRVPVTTTRYSLKKIGGVVKTPWYPWNYQNEVGGYVVQYQNVTFVTVRGAGHFVPSYQPGRALAFFSSFLSGKLPTRQA